MNFFLFFCKKGVQQRLPDNCIFLSPIARALKKKERKRTNERIRTDELNGQKIDTSIGLKPVQ